MEKAKAVFNKWFWIWIAIAAALLITMIVVGNQDGDNTRLMYGLASVIMASFMVMPIRDWLYRLFVWAIDYVSSINTKFKDRVNQHATYNRLVNPLIREENVGFYRTLKYVINFITLIMALLWLVFNRTSFHVVYAFLHTWEFIFRGKISYLAILANLLLTLGFIWLVWWFVGQFLTGKLHDDDGRINWPSAWWKILIMVIGFFAKIIISAILKKYTSDMLIAKLVFWCTTVGIPLIVGIISGIVRRYRASRSATP